MDLPVPLAWRKLRLKVQLGQEQRFRRQMTEIESFHHAGVDSAFYVIDPWKVQHPQTQPVHQVDASAEEALVRDH